MDQDGPDDVSLAPSRSLAEQAMKIIISEFGSLELEGNLNV